MSLTNKAFTVVELLTSLSVVCIVAAIAYPVLGRVKYSSEEAVSKSNMRQLAMTTQIYQADHNGDGVFGNAYQMGLPCLPEIVNLVDFGRFTPPHAPNPYSEFLGTKYIFLWLPPERDQLLPTWERLASTLQAATPMYIDPFNNSSSLPLIGGRHIRRKIFSIDWNGGVRTLWTTKNWDERSFWLEKDQQ